MFTLTVNAQFFSSSKLKELVDNRFILPKSIKLNGKVLSVRLEGGSLNILSYQTNRFSGSWKIESFIFTQYHLMKGQWTILYSTPFSFMNLVRQSQMAN